ncbi:amino acid ABC transporter permease [Facklamia hominis]|uniref:His/Glu/Gln/Arg/opine family amino ABC transporter, permease, 3-TM region n=1 Tax=Facklamia hominis CCUG 36813 TaxID=883111 RepID=K1LH80_9LACT|nr:amino acid ABC transporter permease [Facklamia hominis]EKB53981.1 His/Glu/Gln/Arg/opine family amino ABC transporter, permease, 3-TM region [Facklamia hominis CCUG 36813]
MNSFFDIRAVFEQMPLLLEYLGNTLILALLSMLVGILLGFVIAIIRQRKIPILNALSIFYVSFVRGTPIIIQLYIAYFGIPIFFRYLNFKFGLNLQLESIPKMFYAVTALGINQSAYLSESFRSALLSVDKGTIEAGLTIGMNRRQIAQRIIIPEAMTVALPNIGNSFISLLKGTSLAFSSGVVEMTAAAKLVGGRTYRFIEAYVALAIIYWLLTIILEVLFSFLERKTAIPVEAPELVNSQR